MKTEPSVFSFDDLLKAPKKTTSWEGVRNYQVRNFMRDDFKLGDEAFIYHSGIDEPSIIGIATVVKRGYPDLTALDPKSRYFDERAKKNGASPWILVDVKAVAKMKCPVTRGMLKAESRLKNMVVLQKGSRLSIQPVTPDEFEIIKGLGKPEKV